MKNRKDARQFRFSLYVLVDARIKSISSRNASLLHYEFEKCLNAVIVVRNNFHLNVKIISTDSR